MTPCCGPPELTHTVLSASSANTTWWVLKQVRISLVCPVFGSYMARCRVDCLSGNALAEGWSEPCWQNAGFSGLPTREVNHTSPRSSIIRLCALTVESQI